jgi:uncharacterized membrane protein YhaH (DUF805 family)
MYLSANQYPEFIGKDKKYIRECLDFCVRKSGKRYVFWVVALLLFTAALIWFLWLEQIAIGSKSPYSLLINGVVVGLLFWFYLIYDINTATHKAVKLYLSEFNEQKNT